MFGDKKSEQFCLRQTFPYQGSSMQGTFRTGDMLLTEIISLEDIRLGDVLTFFSSRRDKTCGAVVHRVVAHAPGGLVTQGDAMDSPDTDLVCERRLLGRVIQVQRDGQIYPVKNGWRGRLWVRYLRLQRRLLSLGRVPYHWLRANNIARRLWRPALVRVTLATGQGPLVKYLYSGKTVAAWQPETGAYWCRKPYDLVLDAPGPTTNDPRINE